MKSMEGESLRMYSLPDTELEAAIVVLASAMKGLEGEQVTLAAGGGKGVHVPAAALTPLLDLLSLLVTKPKGLVFVLDPGEEITPSEAGLLLGIPETEVRRLYAEKALEGRLEGRDLRLRIEHVISSRVWGTTERNRRH